MNGIAMIIAFFLVRIVTIPLQWYFNYTYWDQMFLAFHPFIVITGMMFTAILHVLNSYWMYKMIKGAVKHFGKSSKQKEK